MDLHAKYNFIRVIDVCGKMTTRSGERVLSGVADAAAMTEFFALDELQAAAGR